MGTASIRCVGCGALVPDIVGPTHPYMESSPGCWQTYGEVLAREYSNPDFRTLLRLTADTFAVQHPGQPSSQSIQSVCGHLMSLFLILERAASFSYADRALELALRETGRFRWLTPPSSLGEITVVDVRGSTSPAEHDQKVRAWARSTWSAWAPHHDTIREWISSFLEA